MDQEGESCSGIKAIDVGCTQGLRLDGASFRGTIRSMSRRIPPSAFFALLLVCATAAPAQTYKCKNAEGKIGFHDQPCADQSLGSRIAVNPTPPSADPAEISRTKAALSKQSGPPTATDKQNQDIDARNRQIAAQNRALDCERARRNLGTLKVQRPVFRYDNKGDRQYIDDSARQAEISTAERMVAQYCN
jgi:hypothetical protein